VTLAAALDDAIITERERFFVDVETEGRLTRGETVVDRYGVLRKPPNLTVALTTDGPRFKAMLRRAVS